MVRSTEPGTGALLCQAQGLPRSETQPVYAEQSLSRVGMRMTLLLLPALELQDLWDQSKRRLLRLETPQISAHQVHCRPAMPPSSIIHLPSQ